MKFSTIVSLGLVGAASAHYVKSLTEYTNDIPQCAVSAMKEGMKNQGCDISHVDAKDFDCICDHYLSIDGRVYDEVEPSCAADYASAAGILCGAWEVESTTATDLAQATKALGDKLGATKAHATAAHAAPVKDASASKDAAPVENRAPAPTGRFVRSFGGAAVAAAAMNL